MSGQPFALCKLSGDWERECYKAGRVVRRAGREVIFQTRLIWGHVHKVFFFSFSESSTFKPVVVALYIIQYKEV